MKQEPLVLIHKQALGYNVRDWTAKNRHNVKIEHQQQSKHRKIANVVILHTCLWQTHLFSSQTNILLCLTFLAMVVWPVFRYCKPTRAEIIFIIQTLLMTVQFLHIFFSLSLYGKHINIPLLSWDENRSDVCPSGSLWVTVHK